VSDHEGLPVIAIFRKEVTISSKPNAGLCRTDRILSQLSGSTISPRLDRDPLTRPFNRRCAWLSESKASFEEKTLQQEIAEESSPRGGASPVGENHPVKRVPCKFLNRVSRNTERGVRSLR
jgi:hypothetical protein